MKVFQLSLLVVALASASQALAAQGVPSQAALDAMGLAGLEVMSDSEGLAIRGLGYNGASAYGHSFAVVSSHGATAGSTNGYKANGKHVASGHNLSKAVVEIKYGSSHGGGDHGSDYGRNSGHNGGHNSKPKSISIKAFAGGSSFGSTGK